MKKNNIKRRNANEYHNWKNVDNSIKPDFNNIKSLSYILGVLLGDGWVYNSGYNYSICLENTKKLFCETFSRELKKLNLNPGILRRKRKSIWRTTATSKSFYIWFKSLNLSDIKEISAKYPIEFIKGFYESEGSLFINKSSKGKYVYYYPNLVMVNTREDLIHLTAELLLNLGFNPKINLRKPRLKHHKNIYALNVNRKEELIRFLNLIKPCIKNFKTLRNHKFYKLLSLS